MSFQWRQWPKLVLESARHRDGVDKMFFIHVLLYTVQMACWDSGHEPLLFTWRFQTFSATATGPDCCKGIVLWSLGLAAIVWWLNARRANVLTQLTHMNWKYSLVIGRYVHLIRQGGTAKVIQLLEFEIRRNSSWPGLFFPGCRGSKGSKLGNAWIGQRY